MKTKKMKLIEVSYDIGETVYLFTDPDQNKRLVTGINIRPGATVYQLTQGTTDSEHYDFEISREPDLVAKSS